MTHRGYLRKLSAHMKAQSAAIRAAQLARTTPQESPIVTDPTRRGFLTAAAVLPAVATIPAAAIAGEVNRHNVTVDLPTPLPAPLPKTEWVPYTDPPTPDPDKPYQWTGAEYDAYYATHNAVCDRIHARHSVTVTTLEFNLWTSSRDANLESVLAEIKEEFSPGDDDQCVWYGGKIVAVVRDEPGGPQGYVFD